jgi:superfamily II DNA or RNA helicase
MGIISSPTGTGKTFMTAIILETKQRRAMVVLNDLVLMDQTQRELEAMLGCKVGLIGDSEFAPLDVTVATVQSLVTILRSDQPKKKRGGKKSETEIRVSPNRDALVSYLSTVQVAIHDEVHLADSAGVAGLYPYLTNAAYVYGMSATPYSWSGDAPVDLNLEQEQHFGRVIYDTVHEGYNFVDLQARVPVLVRPVHVPVHNTKYNSHFKKEFRRGKSVVTPDFSKNYREALETEILLNTDFHKLVADTVAEYTADGLSNFVFAPHSLEYLDTLHQSIPGSVAVTGKTDRATRRKIFSDLNAKKILCVVSDIGAVGLNVPSLDVLHNTSDYADIRQLEGRVARFDGVKACGVMIDYVRYTTFMDKHYASRLAQYSALGDLVLGTTHRSFL